MSGSNQSASQQAFPDGGSAWAGGGVGPGLQQRADMRFARRAEAEQQGQFGQLMNQQALSQAEEGP